MVNKTSIYSAKGENMHCSNFYIHCNLHGIQNVFEKKIKKKKLFIFLFPRLSTFSLLARHLTDH